MNCDSVTRTIAWQWTFLWIRRWYIGTMATEPTLGFILISLKALSSIHSSGDANRTALDEPSTVTTWLRFEKDLCCTLASHVDIVMWPSEDVPTHCPSLHTQPSLCPRASAQIRLCRRWTLLPDTMRWFLWLLVVAVSGVNFHASRANAAFGRQ